MALSKLKASSIDLTDDFAFTGTTNFSGTANFTGNVSGAGGLIKLGSYTLTNVTDYYDVADVFSADYKMYKIFTSINSSTNNTHGRIQMLLASDGTVDTTGDVNTSTLAEDSDSVARGYVLENANYIQVSTSNENLSDLCIDMTMYNPFQAKHTNTGFVTSSSINGSDAANKDQYMLVGASERANNTSYSGFRFLCNVATTLNGTITVYGLAE